MGAKGNGGHSRQFVTEMGVRLKYCICRRRGLGDNLQLAYLFSWPEWPVSSQEKPVGIWDWE